MSFSFRNKSLIIVSVTCEKGKKNIDNKLKGEFLNIKQDISLSDIVVSIYKCCAQAHVIQDIMT